MDAAGYAGVTRAGMPRRASRSFTTSSRSWRLCSCSEVGTHASIGAAVAVGEDEEDIPDMSWAVRSSSMVLRLALLLFPPNLYAPWGRGGGGG